MKQYYFEVSDSDHLLGKTATFSIQNMDSTEVIEERLYYASKSKRPVTISLKEVSADGSKSNFSRSPQICGKD